jgi:uncharacterized protein with HEPN domain
MRDDRVRLMDMLEAIERIEKYAQSGQSEFLRNELIQNWIIRHLQILGEAAYKVSKDFQEKHPDLPWSNMTGMRHILVHDYFEINTSIVWSVVENELPVLKPKIQAILNLD